MGFSRLTLTAYRYDSGQILTKCILSNLLPSTYCQYQNRTFNLQFFFNSQNIKNLEVFIEFTWRNRNYSHYLVSIE